MLIREEVPGDIDATAELNRTTFGDDYEADLIARLRADGLVIASLVESLSMAPARHSFRTGAPQSTCSHLLALLPFWSGSPRQVA
jgi:hypothetical protein